ncbi:MAG TPA: DUF1127 domain-containing protein [Microvirga sp.]|jgi:uncharacterized protein YjiS (DUF1127 family)|nr:DUF1127 domain-containing protein [Microvirga sp.]
MNQPTPLPLAPSQRPTFVHALTGLLRAVAEIGKALRNRREVRHLSELDDRTLKDIGLSRAEVDGALGEPVYRDPSLVLVRCAERRARVQSAPAQARRTRPVVPVVRAARTA